MKRYLVEFIGTFFLALTVATTATLGKAGLPAPLAIGGILMAMMYAGGHVSGAHFNPAITLGVLLRGHCERHDLIPYLVAQLTGAFVGGVAAQLMMPEAVPLTTPMPAALPVLLAEFLFTFALVFVFLHVATAAGTTGNPFYGAAIGMTMMVGVIVAGPISLGAFNPALSVMLTTLGKLGVADIWMHLLPQILAAGAAAFSFRAILPEDH
jgi:aquaporin Z